MNSFINQTLKIINDLVYNLDVKSNNLIYFENSDKSLVKQVHVESDDFIIEIELWYNNIFEIRLYSKKNKDFLINTAIDNQNIPEISKLISLVLENFFK